MAKPITNSRFRKALKKVTAPQTGWLDVFPAIMGRADGTVLTGVNGVVYVRNILNGQLLAVYNSAVPNIPLLQVEVGRRVDTPGLWQVKGTLESFDVPAGSSSGSTVADHHKQHEFPNRDTTWINRKQILYLTPLVKDPANFIIRFYGGVFETTNGTGQINTQNINIYSYRPTTGAKIITVQTDDNGVLSVVDGDEYASPFVGSFTNIPPADADKHRLFCVVLHEAMTALSNDYIFIPHQFHGGGTTFVAWGNISGTLADQTDLQEALDAKLGVDDFPQILMEDGVTFPPVPLTNETGDDWMYDN